LTFSFFLVKQKEQENPHFSFGFFAYYAVFLYHFPFCLQKAPDGTSPNAGRIHAKAITNNVLSHYFFRLSP